MMEFLNLIVDVIKEVGFPIACVIFLFWQNYQEQKAHKQESDEWVKAINRNTIVMEKILTQLGVDVDDSK